MKTSTWSDFNKKYGEIELGSISEIPNSISLIALLIENGKYFSNDSILLKLLINGNNKLGFFAPEVNRFLEFFNTIFDEKVIFDSIDTLLNKIIFPSQIFDDDELDFSGYKQYYKDPYFDVIIINDNDRLLQFISKYISQKAKEKWKFNKETLIISPNGIEFDGSYPAYYKLPILFKNGNAYKIDKNIKTLLDNVSFVSKAKDVFTNAKTDIDFEEIMKGVKNV